MHATFRRDDRGVAAVEFALVGSLFVGVLFNVAEVSRYAYLSTQVTASSQAAAQAAIVKCSTSQIPVATNCPGVLATVTMALQGSSLGSHVVLVGGLQEGWYCVNNAGALLRMSDAATKPTNCAAAGDATASAALYLKVNASYPFQPMFPGLTIVESFPANISRAAWMRLA